MKSSPKQTDYPIYSEGKLSERKQLFHLSLRNRLPALRQTPISESDTDSQNDERQAYVELNIMPFMARKRLCIPRSKL